MLVTVLIQNTLCQEGVNPYQLIVILEDENSV